MDALLWRRAGTERIDFRGLERAESASDFGRGRSGGVRDPEEGGGWGGRGEGWRCRGAGAGMCAGGAWRGRFCFGEGGLARVVRRGVLGLGVEGRCCAWVWVLVMAGRGGG